jgi:formylglycine-generating enzyme required for sulfatase activity
MMHRYPGSRSFTSDYRHLFFGRDDEKQELFRLIVLNDLVVLFGESGSGKTSLLQAGVCPELEESRYQPVFIRLNNTAEAPELQVCHQLKEGGYIPADMPEDRSLWEYFSRFWYVDLGEVFRPVIVFDQFEELFTLYTPEQRAAFIAQFAAIVNRRPPAGLPPEAATPPEAKFVFSLRSDFLYLLDELSADIPAILRCRFQLRPLDRDRAEAAITRPAAMPGDFASPAFAYSPEALEGILEALGRKGQSSLGSVQPAIDTATAPEVHLGEIAAFQLQMVCQHMESEVIRQKQSAGFRVTPAFYGHAEGIERIINEFYHAVLQKIDPAGQDAVQKLLARGLIRNGRRIMMEASTMRDEYGVPQVALELLHAERLLKRETRKGELYYEISHDTLVSPVLERFKQIEEAELLAAQKAEAERLRAEAAARERELEAERRRSEEAERLTLAAEQGRKRARTFAYLAGLVAAVAIGVGVFAFVKQNEAKTASALAKTEETKAKNALMQVEKEKAATETQRKNAEASALLADEKTKEAEKQAETARRALAEQQKALANVVRLTLKEADKKIHILDYEGALEIMKRADAFNAAPKEVSDALLEIVFFFAETGRYDRAKGVLDTAASLAGQDWSTVKKMTNLTNRTAFRAAIKSLNPERDTFLATRYFPVMISIPGGTDTIGSDSDSYDEKPRHPVTISSFKMAKTETTWWQYNLYCEATGREKPEKPAGWGGEGDNPVIYVDWYDAVAYANWLSVREGRDSALIKIGSREDDYEIKLKSNGYRLPTEAEWEYAARAHTPYEYAGSEYPDSVAWHNNNSGSRTHPVAEKKHNAFGLYDLSGNVWEWCWDWDSAYDPAKALDPIGAEKGGNRVVRGGGWNGGAGGCRVSYRISNTPSYGINTIGFRLSLQ